MFTLAELPFPEIEALLTWWDKAATNAKTPRQRNTLYTIMDMELGSAAANLDLCTAIYWKVVVVFLSPSFDFFVKLLTDSVDAAGPKPPAPDSWEPDLFISCGVTNLGIFPWQRRPAWSDRKGSHNWRLNAGRESALPSNKNKNEAWVTCAERVDAHSSFRCTWSFSPP